MTSERRISESAGVWRRSADARVVVNVVVQAATTVGRLCQVPMAEDEEEEF